MTDYKDSDVTCNDVLPRVVLSEDDGTPEWGWNIGFGQCGMTYSSVESAGLNYLSYELYWNGQTRSDDNTYFILLSQVQL